MLQDVVVVLCIGIVAGWGMDIIIIIVDVCCCRCSSICRRDWMLLMIWCVIAARSTGMHFVIVVAMVVQWRWQVVLGSEGGGVVRGGGIIVVCVDRSAARMHLIRRCQKGIFLHLLLQCGEYHAVVTAIL